MKFIASTSLSLTTLFTFCNGYSFNYGNSGGGGHCPNKHYNNHFLTQFHKLDENLWNLVGLSSETKGKTITLPKGCVCLDPRESGSICTSFQCHETCNINHGTCDAFCCSDPDCSPEQVALFQSIGSCLPDGKSDRLLRCTDTTTLDKVNEKYNMYVEQDSDPLSGLLCVAVENDPFEGEFFQSQISLIGNVALLDGPTYRPDYSFQEQVEGSRTDSFFGNVQTLDISKLEYYTPDVAIVASAVVPSSNGEKLINIWGGYLSLPTSGPQGTCESTNYVQFKQSVQSNSCLRVIDNVKEACQDSLGFLNPILYLENIRIANNPTLSVSDVGNQGWIQPTLGKVYLGSTKLSNTGFKSSWNENKSMCENALVGVKYIIDVNNEGLIQGVEMDFQVEDIENKNSSILLSQQYGIEFIDTNTTEAIPRIVSGNPGYIKGLVVQAGNKTTIDAGLETEKEAIEYAPYGLTMMAASGARGECFLNAKGGKTTQPWYELMNLESTTTASTRVLFGMDSTSSCTVQLTYDEFTNITDWCKDHSTSNLFQLEQNVIGIYGNADPLNSWEWTTIQIDLSNLVQTKPSPEPGALICQNMIDQLNIEILWTDSGQTSNPQPMILGARAVVQQSDWIWRKVPSKFSKQTFSFTHTVTFIKHVQDPTSVYNYKPEIPPVIPAIPSDVFYPFDIRSDAVHSCSKVAIATIISIIYAILL